jgi:PAS domain S-box-containing protein
MEVPSANHPDPLELMAASTAETLAALPEGLMLADGAAGERRIGEILALYRSVFLNSTDPISIIDRNGRYVEQNHAHELLLGFSPDELRGQTPAIHLGEEVYASIVGELMQRGIVRREVASRARDGRPLVLDLSAFAVRDRLGRPVCYVGIKHDITEQRRAASALSRRFEELQVLFRMAETLERARDLNEIYEEAIDALLSVVRADRASVLLFDDDGVMRFKASRGLSDGYRAAVEGHSPWKRDTRHPDPVTVPDVAADPHLAALRDTIVAEGIHALAFVPLADEQQQLLGKLMLYFDTPHAWTADELRLSTTIARHISFAISRHRREAELREANRAKSVFLATMSHELRTPLNAIAGYTDLLDAGVHGSLSNAQRDAIDRIQVNQRHLLRLIDEVLDFAKLEAGHLQLEFSNVPVQETLDLARALIEPQLQVKGVAFHQAPGDSRATCHADRAKMLQIVANLLSNACKFTPAGGSVTLTWDATADQVRVRVSDTGSGIPPNSLETIFEPFVQLHPGFRRKAEGTGLGLSISRELARAMGGDVLAESTMGQGSTFTVTLPRHAPAS